MRNQTDMMDWIGLAMGSICLLGACVVAMVLWTVDLGPDIFAALLMLCVIMVCSVPLYFFLGGKEALMNIGVVERVRERRRIATAAALMERRYRGTDLMRIPEAVSLPIPFYFCDGCGHSYNKTADRMYWVDEQPLLSAGWYCDECVDKLEGKPRRERLNMEIFLLILYSSLATD